MDSLGTIFPTLIVGEKSVYSEYISLGIQIVLFLLFIIAVVRIIKLYLENLELNKDSEKNSEEIVKNTEKLSKTISILIKVASIIFMIIVLSQIFLGNMYIN